MIVGAAIGALLGDGTHAAQAASTAVVVQCTSSSFTAATNVYVDTCQNAASDTSGITVQITLSQTGSLRYALGPTASLALP
jgi:hypothetical protein